MDKQTYDEITRAMEDTNTLWSNLKSELLYSNRFFPTSSGILLKVKKIFERCACTIGGDEKIYFRAREYAVDPKGEFILSSEGMSEKVKHPPRSLIEGFFNLMISANEATPQSKKAIERYIEKMLGDKIQKSEWGYSKEESGRPPSELTGTSRASPRYISYLYLASDVNTALAETRAQIGQLFSVAQYTITKELDVVDLSIASFDEEDFGSEDFFLFLNMNRTFSTPIYSDDRDYIISQFIAEYIKSMGYDGVLFDSSRNKGGFNYTLFDDVACEFIRSELYKAENITIASNKVFPFEA